MRSSWGTNETIDSRLQLNCQQTYCLHESSFHFLMNRCIFGYKSMKSVKIKINRWTKRACHRFLPIDRYKLDLPIFIHLLIDKSIPIFIDWLLRDISDGVRNDVIPFLLLGNFRLKAISHQQIRAWFFAVVLGVGKSFLLWISNAKVLLGANGRDFG